jgi:hypothetical protein
LIHTLMPLPFHPMTNVAVSPRGVPGLRRGQLWVREVRARGAGVHKPRRQDGTRRRQAQRRGAAVQVSVSIDPAAGAHDMDMFKINAINGQISKGWTLTHIVGNYVLRTLLLFYFLLSNLIIVL